jgi:hypothetical protein
LAVCFDTVCITDGLPQSHGGAAMPRRPPHPQSGVQPLPSLLQLHERVAQHSPSLFGLHPQPSFGGRTVCVVEPPRTTVREAMAMLASAAMTSEPHARRDSDRGGPRKN